MVGKNHSKFFFGSAGLKIKHSKQNKDIEAEAKYNDNLQRKHFFSKLAKKKKSDFAHLSFTHFFPVNKY